MTQRKILLAAAIILLATANTQAQVTTGSGTVGANTPTTNPRLGINITNPDYPLHIRCGDYNGTTQGLNAAFPNNGILVQKDSGTSGASLYLQYVPSTGRRWAMTSTGPNNAAGTGNFVISDMNAGVDRIVIKGGTGEIGIGTLTPSNAAEIFFADHASVGNNGLLLSNSGTHAATLYLANTSAGGRRWALASTGSSNAGGAGNLAIADITGASNAVVIEGSSGNFGINVDNPDAQLHVDGTVRFENLPTGEGNALVIDASGNVKVAESFLYKNAQLEQEVKSLREQVAMLMKELTERLPSSAKPLGYLEQNSPNPFTSNTVIRFYISQTTSAASLMITDLNGRVIKSVQVSGYGQQTVTIAANELGTGTYIYSLVVSGQVIDSKKMVLVR
jgi:hypothetical protein